MTGRRFSCVVVLAATIAIAQPAGTAKAETEEYLGYVTKCLDTLIECGTDRYGPKQTPVLVSILDTETCECPAHPAALDESWRVGRRDRRNPKTDLCADRPNAGANRFDGSHFVTSDTGLYCHALLKCYELTGEALFKDQALAYLKAYRKYGYDSAAGRFWGSLRLDGIPVAGPRLLPPSDGKREDYAVYEPRGYLDLWQPYVAGYEHPVPTAQAYAFAFSLTNDPAILDTARLFAKLLEANLPPRSCLKESWYRDYAEHYAPEGTYAGLYGQAVSFLLHMYLLTGEPDYLGLARGTADDAIARLYRNGLFCGHPAKPYYEAVDGVGYLLYALLELDQVIKHPEPALSQKAIVIGEGSQRTALPLDNW